MTYESEYRADDDTSNIKSRYVGSFHFRYCVSGHIISNERYDCCVNDMVMFPADDMVRADGR